MANVIPREGLSAIRKRNAARFLLVGSLMIAGAAVVAILAILPAYISVRIARAAVDSAPSNGVEGSITEEQTAAIRTQGLIANLTPVANATTSPSAALSDAIALKPPGISITTISYTAGNQTILLTGTSERREALNTFRDALESSNRFSNVAVPVAALVGTQEGRFTITLTGI